MPPPDELWRCTSTSHSSAPTPASITPPDLPRRRRWRSAFRRATQRRPRPSPSRTQTCYRQIAAAAVAGTAAGTAAGCSHIAAETYMSSAHPSMDRRHIRCCCSSCPSGRSPCCPIPARQPRESARQHPGSRLAGCSSRSQDRPRFPSSGTLQPLPGCRPLSAQPRGWPVPAPDGLVPLQGRGGSRKWWAGLWSG